MTLLDSIAVKASSTPPGPGRDGRAPRQQGDAMNGSLVKRIADAILYEGYILYPYPPKHKAGRRGAFGILAPQAACPGDAQASSSQTECLVRASGDARVEATVRF